MSFISKNAVNKNLITKVTVQKNGTVKKKMVLIPKVTVNNINNGQCSYWFCKQWATFLKILLAMDYISKHLAHL